MNRSMTDIPDTALLPDWNQLAEEVHACAVAHGWYEQAPSMTAVLTNIHAEFSEAWEAFRDHRPMLWHACGLNEADTLCTGCTTGCTQMSVKPEGIAIELADAVLRMLDTCGFEQLDIAAALEQMPALLCSHARAFLRQENTNVPLADLLAYLHEVISCAHVEYRVATGKANCNTESFFAECILLISDYIRRHSDTTLAECIQFKHAYNLTRPYRHGGKAV
ncbi:MAG: hypothetical protein VB087_09765 [Candidatus Limiplasma sp.]|nr:hypothetical protein [Candidatus Limiplasma sp.]